MGEVPKTEKRSSRPCILISLQDKTEYPFLSLSDADDFLNRKHGYIRACLRNGNRICRLDINRVPEYFEIEVGPARKNFAYNNRFPDQLCWTCKKACGGCKWSRCFMPIDGWTAVSVFKDRAWTYSITACPEYDKETYKRRTV